MGTLNEVIETKTKKVLTEVVEPKKKKLTESEEKEK